MIIGQAPLPSSPRRLALGQPCFRRKVIKVRAFVSSGRPGEITTAKDVEVQVEDVLAGAVAVVHDQPEVVADPALPRDLAHHLQQPATQRLVLEVGEPLDVLPGHDQDVEGRAREDVVDGHHVIVLVDDRRGELPRHDATEQAVVHAAKRIATCR